MATTVQSIDTEGVLTLNRALTLPDEATDDDGNYISGLWLKIETRLYILHAVPATTRIAVEPVAVAEIGDAVHAATSIDVRLAEEAPLIPRTPDFWGPLGFSWVEAI